MTVTHTGSLLTEVVVVVAAMVAEIVVVVVVVVGSASGLDSGSGCGGKGFLGMGNGGSISRM